MKLSSLHSSSFILNFTRQNKHMVTYKPLAMLASTTLLLVGFTPNITAQVNAKEIEMISARAVSELHFEESRIDQDLSEGMLDHCLNANYPFVCFARGSGEPTLDLESSFRLGPGSLYSFSDASTTQISGFSFE